MVNSDPNGGRVTWSRCGQKSSPRAFSEHALGKAMNHVWVTTCLRLGTSFFFLFLVVCLLLQ